MQGTMSGMFQGQNQPMAETARRELGNMHPQHSQSQTPLTAVESEIGYAAKEADKALQELIETFGMVESKLAAVICDIPVPSRDEGKQAHRPVSSPLASGLVAHAEQIRMLRERMYYLLNRLAL